MIERVLFQATAKLETTNLREMIVQQDQIRLQLKAKLPGGFRVFCCEDVVLLIFQERLPVFAFR